MPSGHRAQRALGGLQARSKPQPTRQWQSWGPVAVPRCVQGTGLALVELDPGMVLKSIGEGAIALSGADDVGLM